MEIERDVPTVSSAHEPKRLRTTKAARKAHAFSERKPVENGSADPAIESVNCITSASIEPRGVESG